MQDRFRFRVWNIKEKEMIYNAEIAYDGMNYNTEWQLGKNENDGWVDCFGYYLDYPEEYEVMQCTGLKDKNGKLIFEGDIVKKEVFIDYQGDGQFQPDVYVDRTYIGVVHFTASNGATLQKVKVYETESPYEPKKQRDKRECPKATKLIACRSEVIGNIYENKELLDE
jgi:uncharacterized phage protein (TIGR01671 family)